MSGPVLDSPEQYAASQVTQTADDRRHERRPLNSVIRITYITCCSDSPSAPLLGRGVDISDSGVAFEIDAVLDFHRLMVLEYTDDADRSCKRIARLRYRMNRTYGSCFVDIERRQRPQ